jgi:predicted NodU family carbamoyl transferase
MSSFAFVNILPRKLQARAALSAIRPESASLPTSTREEPVDVLGICALDRPSAACLVRDGRVLAAVREEAFSGRAGDRSFPSLAVAYCLRAAKIGPAALDGVAAAAPLDRRIPVEEYPESGRAVSSLARRVSRWVGRRKVLGDLLREEIDGSVRAESLDAALAEAGAAYFASPFDGSAVLVLEAGRVTRWLGRNGTLEPLGPLAAGDVVERAARTHDETGAETLCLGGPGAMDRARNAALRHVSGFDRIWVAPAPGVEAAAIGAAMLAWSRASGKSPLAPSEGGPRIGTALGPAYNAAQIRTFLRSQGVRCEERLRDEAPRVAAGILAEGREVAWMDGRLDVGEDTAGSRALLRAPSPTTPPEATRGETLAVAAERVADLFDVEPPCPSWLELPLAPAWRAALADVRHPEGPLPLTPIAGENRGFRALLAAYEQATGIPAVVARPLRRPGGPVACAPSDAWAARAASGVDTLVMGTYVFAESSEPPLTQGEGAPEIGANSPTAPRSP